MDDSAKTALRSLNRATFPSPIQREKAPPGPVCTCVGGLPVHASPALPAIRASCSPAHCRGMSIAALPFSAFIDFIGVTLTAGEVRHASLAGPGWAGWILQFENSGSFDWHGQVERPELRERK